MNERVRGWLSRIPRLRAVILLGACGILLILLSGLLPDSQKTEQRKPAETASDSTAQYRADLEARLSAWLGQMEGVGEVQVMITLSSSAEQQFAEEVKASENDRGVTRESEVVLARSNGAESALIARTTAPEICGAAVLCSGGGHAAVRERVCAAVTTVLGIPASAVYVGKAT
jgi:stage III sporulation protein AG